MAPLLEMALTDADPRTRAVAARVAAVAGHARMTPLLRAALQKETADLPGAEQVRALLLLGGVDAAGLVDRDAKRLGGRALVALAEWISSHQPERFVNVLTEFHGRLSNSQRRHLPALIVRAGRQQPHLLAPLLKRWLESGADIGWQLLLDRALFVTKDLAPHESMLMAALQSADPQIRDATVWFLHGALARGTVLSANIADQAVRGFDSQHGPVDWELFGRELHARRLRIASTVDRTEFIRKHKDTASRLFDAKATDVLTKDEQRALKALFPSSIATARYEPAVALASARTMPEPAPGVLASTMAAAHCPPARGRDAVARVTYRADGRTGVIAIDPRAVSTKCASALTAMSKLALAEPEAPLTAGDQQWLVMIMEPDFIECTAAPSRLGENAPVPFERSQLPHPKKIRDLRPVYPANAVQARIQGTVYLEAAASARGCVHSVKVMQSAHPALDLSALVAVSGWKFEPPTIGGQPSPFTSLVTVNFVLF